MSTDSACGAASFRDPDGRLFSYQKRILRAVNARGRSSLDAFLTSQAMEQQRTNGGAVSARVLAEAEAAAVLADPAARRAYDSCRAELLVEHEAIPFPSYPAEWSAEMLHAAGEHTIGLARALLEEGLGLKDATPYNILFRGPQPVFVDALSVERRDPRDPIWLPYAQFQRTFVLPLLAHRYFGIIPAQVFTNQRDGMEAEELYRLASVLQRMRPPFLGAVSLPRWLSHSPAGIYSERRVEAAKAKFILERRLAAAQTQLQKLKPRGQTSDWAAYAQQHNYSEAQLRCKEGTIERVLRQARPQRVLDVGCNTGRFSLQAAAAGAAVVALDLDAVSVGRVWRAAVEARANVLPLVVNLARPTPAMGWRNQETPSFLERARGGFDCVLMLAVLHHLLVTERIPLDEVLALAAELTRDLLVIEYVAPEDPMFRLITRGREHLHAGLNQQVFERSAAACFEQVECRRMDGAQRWLYVLKKRHA